MNIKPIRNDTDYRSALASVERVMGAAAGTPEGRLLDALVVALQAYEAGAFPDPTNHVETKDRT